MERHNHKPVIIIGGGGHASVLVDILLSQNRSIIAVFCPDEILNQSVFTGISQYKNDEDILTFPAEDVVLVNGIGMLPKSDLRLKTTQKFLTHGYKFETVIANGACVSNYAQIEQGAQIFTGAVVQTGACIGAQSIINTNATIEHDCKIGQNSHVAPGAILCGQVIAGNGVFIGAGATVIQNIQIGDASVVGANSLLRHDLNSNQVYYPNKAVIN